MTMVLADVVKVMPKSQEIVVFQGFNVRYIGRTLDCQDENILKATVKNLESNGKNITIKLI